MKSTPRFTARRVFQGSAAFAAFGALSLAAALPAYADGETYGWAAASAAGGQDRLESHITQEQSESGTFDTSIGTWLTVSGTTGIQVDANGAQASAVVENGRIVLTESDLEDILGVSEGEGDDTDDTDAGDEGEGDDAGDDGEGDDTDGEGEGEEDGGDETGDDGEGDDTDDTDDGDDGDDDGEGDEEELQENASGVIQLDETNSVLTDGGDTILFEDTFTGSVTTTQTWAGDVTHESTPDIGDPDHLGRFKAEVDGEKVTVDVVLAAFGGEEENTDSGYVWDDAFTFLTLNFAIDGEYVSGFPVAESVAGITTDVHDDGESGGGDEGGDDKTPPKRTEDNVPKPDPKQADLAQTGTPVVGLLAAGAALAAGGGAAAYLARRKKNTAADEFDETAEK